MRKETGNQGENRRRLERPVKQAKKMGTKITRSKSTAKDTSSHRARKGE